MAIRRALPVLLSLAAALLLAKAGEESEENFPKFRDPDPHVIQVPPKQRRFANEEDRPARYRHIIDTLPRKPPSRRAENDLSEEEDLLKFRDPRVTRAQVPPKQRRFANEEDRPAQYRHIIDTLPRKPPTRRTVDVALEEMCAILQQDKIEEAATRALLDPHGSSQSTRRGMNPLLNIADKGLEFGKSMLYLPSLLFEPNAEVAKNPTSIYQDRYVIATR